MTKRLTTLLLPLLLPVLLPPSAAHAAPPRPKPSARVLQAGQDPEAGQEAGGEALPPVPAQAAANAAVRAPVVSSHYAVLVDAVTGEVLWTRNADARRPIASTTKMLTAILLLERGHLDDVVTAPNGVQYLPDSSLHLRPGEKITLRDLLYAMLLRSANDTAVTGAVYLSGSVPAFARLMNEKAREIGATHSHFVTPNGLPAPGHYSTAGDLAKIACYAINTLPQFNQIVRTPFYKVRRSIDTRDVVVKNTALTFLKKFPGADGVKTGYIHAAGHCFVGSATRGGWRLVAVALDSGKCREDVESLLNYGFADFAPVTVARRGEPVGTVDIPSAAGPVRLVESDDIAIVRSRRRATPPYKVRLTPIPLLPQAPIGRGTLLGSVAVIVGGKALASGGAVSAEDVPLRPGSAFVRATRAVGPALLETLGALAGISLVTLGGWIVYARAAAKSARGRRRRLATGLRGVDHRGPRPG
jgi:D-alanyl-D-alanine carboxypeptidase (penicillin-binding protein 5/6)